MITDTSGARLITSPRFASIREARRGGTVRFFGREEAETARLRQVLDLVTHAGCQWNFLTAHFGEKRASPCGQCTYCRTRQRQKLPPRAAAVPPLPDGLDVAALASVRATHPEALGEPRQVARFLCGLSSPALTKAKLSRHPLFGSCEERPFGDVLRWCEANAAP